jgi:VIT1/CCC1 family predicted Fe2+/Mn2+ transporter
VDKGDWKGAAGVFLLVFLSTFPVVIPFALLRDISLALRLSNAVAVGMLFLTGYAFGRITGRRPWGVGIFMMLLGALLVGLTIALGG